MADDYIWERSSPTSLHGASFQVDKQARLSDNPGARAPAQRDNLFGASAVLTIWAKMVSLKKR